MLDPSALSVPPLVVIIQKSQTFPLWSVMHEGYEDITTVDFTLTEPSRMIGEKAEGGELWLAHLSKTCLRYCGIRKGSQASVKGRLLLLGESRQRERDE